MKYRFTHDLDSMKRYIESAPNGEKTSRMHTVFLFLAASGGYRSPRSRFLIKKLGLSPSYDIEFRKMIRLYELSPTAFNTHALQTQRTA